MANEFLVFSAFSDIQARPGFSEENPISTENFQHIVGYYHFSQKHGDVRCQVERCGTKHLRGWVAKLKDGTESNMGWICANKHFKGHEEFQSQRKAFERQQRILRYLETITAALDERDETQEVVDAYLLTLQEIRQLTHDLRSYLPRTVITAIREMIKTGNASVIVQIGHPEIQEDGGEKIEWINQSLGAIDGLQIWNADEMRGLFVTGDRLRSALQDSEPDEGAGETALKEWAEALSSLEGFISDVEKVAAAAARFRQFQNMLRLAFVCRSQDERFETGKIALKYSLDDEAQAEKKPSSGKAAILAVERDIRDNFGPHLKIP